MTGLGPLAEAMATAVTEERRQRVSLTVLIRAATAVDHSGPGRADWRNRVAAAIEELIAAGLVVPSVTRWDRRTQPHLPEWVAKPPRATPKVVTRAEPWHVALQWIPALAEERRLSSVEEKLVVAVNRWLPAGRDSTVVPMRERSWQLVGDDKALERLRRGRLFGLGRLSLDLLRCRATWPPVQQHVFGSGVWLIVENWSTYESLVTVAAERGFAGRIIFGSGNQVGTRLIALADAGERPDRPVLYFGDVDAGGVKAARLAVATAGDLGWPPVEPCRPLYALAIGSPHRLKETPAGAESVRWARHWITGADGSRIAGCLAQGDVVRQEAVGLETLRRSGGRLLEAW